VRVALWTFAALIIIVVLIVAVGWMLPVRHQASRTVTLDRSSAEVYAAIRDVEAYPRWRSDLERVELIDARSTLPRFREVSADSGTLTMAIVEDLAPSKLVTRIDEAGLPFGGTWTFVVESTHEGARLTITEDGDVYNPMFRFVSRFVLGHHRTIDRYLADLRAWLAGPGPGR
jgi:hypothetical protein